MLTPEDLKQLSNLLDEKFEKNNAILRMEIVQSAESVKTELRAEIAQTAESIKAELRAEIAQTAESLRNEIVQSNTELREATSMSISQLREDLQKHHYKLKTLLLFGYFQQIVLLASA